MSRPLESLSLLLPTPAETDLLRACLWSGAAGQAAWARWQQAVGEPTAAFKSDVSGVKALLPLLHAGLRHGHAEMDAAVSAALGTAALAETVRERSYARIGARACEALWAAEIPFLLVGGAAFGATVYGATALRHSHDVDVLVHARDRGRAVAALQRAGFAEGERRSAATAAVLLDPSALPLVLHERFFRLAYYTAPLAEIWGRSQSCELGGALVPTLSAADHLLHVCGNASSSRDRDHLKWAADAWLLLKRQADLDWEILLASSATANLDLPLATLLGFLAGELEAPVPAVVLERLRQRAALADRGAREVALVGLRASPRGTYRKLMAATRTARGRLELMRWILLPTPTSLRLGEPLRWPWAWPVYYPLRPLAYVARRARRR